MVLAKQLYTGDIMDYLAIVDGVVVNLVVFDEVPEDITLWGFDSLILMPAVSPGIGWVVTSVNRYDNPSPAEEFSSEYIEDGVLTQVEAA